MVTEQPVTQSDGNTAFLRAARAGNLDKVLEHLKSDVDINTANANGLNALHLASKEGHTHVVTELLSRGATVDASTKKGNTALHIASLAGQEEVVKLLVQHGAAVNVQSQNGFTPLYMAAQENHDSVVKFLLANGANQSLATEDGFTPLAVAMQQGHDKVVAVLLENDTRGKVRLPALHIAAKKDDCKAAALLLQNEHNPDVTSKSGFTPLHIAAHYGNEAIANLLLNKGADVNYSAKHNISPLHVAAKWGKSNLVALLLERGAHIEAKTRDGLTPLHCAARSGHEQVVDMMLERGAPISCKTKNGLAPLHMAAQGDHVDAARILLYHRAPVDEITVDYLTALHVAAHCGHVRVAKLLLDRKADPNARALNGFTPLHIACKKNRIKVVELLLKHGASIEATTESGLTPLHVASFMGCMNIVIYLLQNEANPDVPTVRGETPLHLAARANQTDIIRILLRNGAQVDARAREQQTPLHIASRLGNVDIVMLLLQHGAAVDSTTKDLYTALHIAAKEGQEEVAAVLLENGASLTATTNKGCTPLHLAAKYGNMKVARLLLQKDAPVDSQGKNGVTPLHVASHYDHQNVALLLLDKGASPHATAKNGHTPLHIAARKNQMDIATTLLEYGAKANAESRAGFTPLHLSSQEGHTDMSTLLIEHQADTNHQAKNGLTPLHLCAQEDRVNVAQILVKNAANVDSTTKAGYTPLHVASHFGQVNMVRFLLQHGADTSAVTSVGYTPLHQAAQQGHSGVISILLNSGAQPNVTTKQGQTALSIAQKLGYISVVETLKVVTEVTTITTTTTTTIEEKYKVVAPETMQETFMSDSEEEGGEDTLLNEQPYHYLTVDEMKSLGDDSLPIDVTQDDRHDSNRDLVSPQHAKEVYAAHLNYASDNVDISRHPVNVGFLVSFLVDARGGAMRGCRHSGVRVIVPPRKAPQPLRVTCRYLKRDKLSHPPPLMEGEALASRILELGPVGAKFLGPVIIEVPHFGSLRGREREIVILRSDNGETWREHTVEASEEAVQDVLNESFEKDELNQLEVCDSGRLTRILTTDFPQYFAVVSRIRQEVHAIGPEGGMVSSSVVPQVQAVFPQGALTKKIKVGLQAQPIPTELVAKLLGNRVAVSPIVTVEPRRRKFHKPITLTIPVPQAANKGMINQYSGDAPTLRLLCSITGGTTRAQWEDVTGSTPLTFVNDCVSFTTTVSARFWLMDCRNISDATRMATELYKEAIHVPFLAKFVVFAKRVDFLEARLRVFCMTDDKEDKTLEHQEHFTEVAKSRDVEVLEGKAQFVEFAGNLVPVTKSGDQLQLSFRGFRENRLAFTTRVKDPHADPVGRILFMKEAKVQKGDPPQQPVCVLNIVLPDDIIPDTSTAESTPQKYSHGHLNGSTAPARPELRLSDISNTLGSDWESLAVELGLSRSDVDRIKSDHPAAAAPQHALTMLRLWLQRLGNKASATELQQALQRLGRDDIIHRCMISCDDQEMNLTSSHLGLDQSGFDNLQDELGVSRDASRETSLRRNLSLEAGSAYDEQDLMKDSESVEELVEKQISSIERIAEAKEIVKRRSKDRDDSEERKYIAEEKEVEEKRKSVRERTQDIEKRLSQSSMEEQQQRRDSQLLQGVTEGFERFNIAQPTEAGGEPNWLESKVTTTPISTEQHSGSQGVDAAVVKQDDVDDTMELERGKANRTELVSVGPTHEIPCLPILRNLTCMFPIEYPQSSQIFAEPLEYYRSHGRLSVLREVDNSDDDKYGSGSLLDESDLSALAEATMKLEELEETVGRILCDVQKEQSERTSGLLNIRSQGSDASEYVAPSNLNYGSRSVGWTNLSRLDDIDKCSRDAQSQLNDLGSSGGTYKSNKSALDYFNDSDSSDLESKYGSRSATASYSQDNYCFDEFNADSPDIYGRKYLNNCGTAGCTQSCLCAAALQEDSQECKQDIFTGSDRSEESLTTYPFSITFDSEDDSFMPFKCQADLNLEFQEIDSANISHMPTDNEGHFNPVVSPFSLCPGWDSQFSLYPSCSDEMCPSAQTCNILQVPSCVEGCSLEDLEKCIDKLVSDVEREEARLRHEVKCKLENRTARFSMPTPPCFFSDDPRELKIRRASSVNSLIQTNPSQDIWWEGTYRNLEREPDSPSFNTGVDDVSVSSLSSFSESGSDLENNSIRGQIALLVRTTAPGKDTIEIRCMRYSEPPSEMNCDHSEAPMSAISSPATHLAYDITPEFSDSHRLQRLYVNAPPFRELRSYSLEDIVTSALDIEDRELSESSTLPCRKRCSHSYIRNSADHLPLEFSPPSRLVRYVIPQDSQLSVASQVSSPSPCPIEYVTHLPGPTPGRGYCTWLPNPSPRGKG